LYDLISSASEKSILYDIVQSVQFNSHGSSVSSQSGIGLGVQSTSLVGISSASLQQPPNPVHSPSSQQPLMPGVSIDAGMFCVSYTSCVLLNNFSPFQIGLLSSFSLAQYWSD